MGELSQDEKVAAILGEFERIRWHRTILLDSAKDMIAWCDKTGSGDALYCIDRLRHAIATAEAGKPTAEVVWRYVGGIYVRPVGRGICLEELANQPHLEDVLPEGDFHAEIVVRRKRATESGQPPAEAE